MEEKTLTEIKNLKPGRYVMVDGEPCTVVSVQISRPGKHGAAKAKLTAVGIFDNQKRVIVKPSGDKIPVPLIVKKSNQVISISGDVAQLMDVDTYEMFEAKIPDDLKDKIKEGEEVITWRFGKRVMIVGTK